MAGHLVEGCALGIELSQDDSIADGRPENLGIHMLGCRDGLSLTAASWACQALNSMAGHSAEMMVVKLARLRWH
jgi:hypothetical protein